ncbi:MAG: phycobilisome protein [Microcoleaceae cyanobacterium]
MNPQLSPKAQQLIPKARIVSFANWKDLYSDEVLQIFQQADDAGRYLTDEDLAQIQALSAHQTLGIEQARLLREQADTLVSHAREQLLAKMPQITKPGGGLYPAARAEACWRDFWHFLRCITYGIAGNNPEFTSPEGLKNMQLLYEELQVPLDAMICGLEYLKNYSIEQFPAEQSPELIPYFDHLIDYLKDF